MIHASSRLPHSLPHSPFPTLPHFLSLKIVESDLVNRFVNCAKYAYIYIYTHTHTHDLAHHHRRFITLPPPPPTDTNIHLYGHAPPPFNGNPHTGF